MILFQLLAITLLSLNLVRAHTVIVYPGYRGNNLHTNGTVEETNGLGAAEVNGSYAYPYGMEWIYPCTSLFPLISKTLSNDNEGGGMPTSANRTKWPIAGGAVAVQPGWFPGHQEGFIYMNMGFGTIPPNMSNPMIKPFGIVGPTNNPYPGTFCLPQVPLPSGFTAHMGGHATIQVVLAAKHGAALYNVCFPLFFCPGVDGKLMNSAWMSNSRTPKTYPK